MGTNLLAELANLLDILILKVFFCQATIGFDQTPGKIRRTIAHELFNLIKHRSHLSWGEASKIEEAYQACKRPRLACRRIYPMPKIATIYRTSTPIRDHERGANSTFAWKASNGKRKHEPTNRRSRLICKASPCPLRRLPGM